LKTCLKLITVLILPFNLLMADFILIPMDLYQRDHLKAYGIAYWVLQRDTNVEWLLNYRGGSFLFPKSTNFENECQLRGVRYEIVSATDVNKIYSSIFIGRSCWYSGGFYLFYVCRELGNDRNIFRN